MKYIALVYYDESEIESLSGAQWESLVGECLGCVDELGAGGYLVAGEALQPTNTATTVRVRSGKVTMTDGPFAETKEQLAGFYLLEARDLNDALKVASKIPTARYGSVEVRPVRDLHANSGR